MVIHSYFKFKIINLHEIMPNNEKKKNVMALNGCSFSLLVALFLSVLPCMSPCLGAAFV